jgi:tRNA U34 5-carboxymethylaminomethyl modifying GTPase MnmE/TrmE
MSLCDWKRKPEGKTATEDLLDSIFSQFCIGK